MRTGHILKRDAKGVSLVFDGVHTEAKEKLRELTKDQKKADTFELYSSDGGRPKIIKFGAPSEIFKKKPETDEEKSNAAAKAKKAAAAIVVFLFLAFQSFAQQNIIPNLPAIELGGATTNAGPGGGLIGWNIDQVAVIQGALYQTNTAHATTISNAVIRFDTSNDGRNWQISAYNYSLAPTGVTNAGTGFSTTATTITRLTNTIGGKWLRAGIMENVNTNRIYWANLSISLKE